MLLAGLEAGAKVCGVMARVPVPGSPLASYPPVSAERLAQLVAVTRICCGQETPDICVHPPVAQAVAWGANVLVVETGAIPRDGGGDCQRALAGIFRVRCGPSAGLPGLSDRSRGPGSACPAPVDVCLPDGTEALCRFTRGIKKRRPRLGTP